jgi:hypothetical protein
MSEGTFVLKLPSDRGLRRGALVIKEEGGWPSLNGDDLRFGRGVGLGCLPMPLSGQDAYSSDNSEQSVGVRHLLVRLRRR